MVDFVFYFIVSVYLGGFVCGHEIRDKKHPRLDQLRNKPNIDDLGLG